MTNPAGAVSEVAGPDLMRLIAHELRQPLSTIGSVAYYLSLILPPGDEKIHEQLTRLQQLVEQSSWILANGQQLTEVLRFQPEPVDIEELITESIAARSAAGGAPAQLSLAGNLPPVHADPGLARALFENLLILFRLVSSTEFPTCLRTAPAEGGAAIEIVCGASGFRSEASLGPGSTLSLECARRVVERHGGALTLNIDPSSGIQMRVVLP